MSDLKMTDASFESKAEFKLPEGATILKKDYRLTVEEIENGFILRKSYDIEYQVGDNKEYSYYHKKWFSEDNPIQIDEDFEEKSLADKLD